MALVERYALPREQGAALLSRIDAQTEILRSPSITALDDDTHDVVDDGS
jgi:hypothetical protein